MHAMFTQLLYAHEKTTLYQVLIRKIVSEYDQGITQSQTTDKPMEPRGRARKTHLAKLPALSSSSR